MVTEKVFGELNGRNIKSYTITNSKGLEVTCIDYGCTITELKVPDRHGNLENIVLGFDTLAEYITQSPYFGCVIGRSAGRIDNASFELGGKQYKLPQNDGNHNLHSGPNGFHNVVWNSEYVVHDSCATVTFSYTSPDGEEGFPGNLSVTVRYSLNDANELTIQYNANTDQKTVVNLTNHSYFNLSGNAKRTIIDHELTMKSDGYLELDSSLIPTGKINPVEGTGFDFRRCQKIQAGIRAGGPQTEIVGGGFDHPFILKAHHQDEIVLTDPVSGRQLVVETDEPCVVFYTGNMLGNDFVIRGKQSEKHLGLCLETQKPPNMFTDPHFPTSLLEASQVYESKTKYSFAICEK